MEQKKKLKMKAISLLFTFLLTMLLIVLFICLDLYFGIFHDKSILRKVNESNYYNEVYKVLNSDAEKLVTEAGLPASVMKDVISLERVYINGKLYTEAALQGRTADISTTKLREKLIENINSYLAGADIFQEQELVVGVDELVTDVEQMYLQGIRMEYIHYLAEYRLKFLSALRWVIPLILLLGCVICYFLINMHPYRHRGIRQIDYALNASSILVIVTAVVLLNTGKYMRSEVTPEYYRNFIDLSLQWNFQVLLYLGCIGVALSLVLITLIGFMKNRI
jgi:hypothetical protein